MKTDRFTKALLGVIALFLGILLLNRPGPSATAAPVHDGGDAYASVEIIPAQFGFIMFDRKTGGVWEYQTTETKGFPFARLGTGGTIAKPGDDVRQNP